VKHGIALLLALEVLCAAGEATADGPIREVAVARARLSLGDVLPQLAPEVGAIDLGPSPAPGGARLFTREELRKRLSEAHAKIPASLPAAVRVVRKVQRVGVKEIEQITRRTVDAGVLPRGAALSAVHPSATVEIPAGWDTVRASLPQRPHRAGVVRSTALLTFTAGADTLASLPVPIELSLTVEAAAWDLPRGAGVKVVVRRGAVEIEAPATAGADADVGSVLPVTLKASGRVVRVKLVDKEHAELLEGG
jgi:hypothetical protein